MSTVVTRLGDAIVVPPGSASPPGRYRPHRGSPSTRRQPTESELPYAPDCPATVRFPFGRSSAGVAGLSSIIRAQAATLKLPAVFSIGVGVDRFELRLK